MQVASSVCFYTGRNMGTRAASGVRSIT